MQRAVTVAQLRLRHASSRVCEPWRQFWFRPADPTPLCVMRILFGGMLLYTHAVWGLNLDGFFGPHGWQDESLVRLIQPDPFVWSFWWWVPDGLRLTVHIVALVVLFLYLVGMWTGATSVLAYLITVSYAYRAPLANYGLDQINAIAALYLAIGPSGAVLSADRLWRSYRRARTQLLAGEKPDLPPVAPSVRANLALRLIQVHLCVIYVFACLSKLQGESWWNGQAIWQAVSNLEYQSRDLTWLAWYPWLVNLLTHVTIVWEMTFWALVWKPFFRPIVLLIGVAIHVGIGAFLGMWTFGLAVVFLYTAFVPAETLQALLRRAARTSSRGIRAFAIDPERLTGIRLRALCSALHFEAADAASQDDPQVETSPSDAAAVEPPTQSTVVDSDPAGVGQIAVERFAATTRQTSRPALGRRPTLVLVESRLKRQTQIQEYLIKRGFRCLIASELHEARSLLAVVDVDVLVVTSSWLPAEEIVAFREALLSGGPSLPASVFLVSSALRKVSSQLVDRERHHVIRETVSLRELRLAALNVLGLSESVLRPSSSRATRPANGRKAEPPDAAPRSGNGMHHPLSVPQPTPAPNAAEE